MYNFSLKKSKKPKPKQVAYMIMYTVRTSEADGKRCSCRLVRPNCYNIEHTLWLDSTGFL